MNIDARRKKSITERMRCLSVEDWRYLNRGEGTLELEWFAAVEDSAHHGDPHLSTIMLSERLEAYLLDRRK